MEVHILCPRGNVLFSRYFLKWKQQRSSHFSTLCALFLSLFCSYIYFSLIPYLHPLHFPQSVVFSRDVIMFLHWKPDLMGVCLLWQPSIVFYYMCLKCLIDFICKINSPLSLSLSSSRADVRRCLCVCGWEIIVSDDLSKPSMSGSSWFPFTVGFPESIHCNLTRILQGCQEGL